ncbi:MAG TPA: TonB-dependent receptor [Gemmatimonas sp.]|uniref:TonB-dependent receptor plug domain-containing protein n=1 Tax=Gemmatimonas sp. TaxID=1962908 RepID=UPI002EDAE21E
MLRTLPLPILAVVLTAQAAGAQASAQPPVRDTSARSIERINVRGSRTPTVTGGATAVVVRPDSLPVPLAPAPALADVLRQTAFVTIRQNSRGEMEVGVRGSDSRQASVMLDGLPLSVSWDSRVDLSITPTTGVDQVVVVRGLSSLLQGANTLGGVIRMDLNGPLNANTSPSLRIGTGFDQFSSRVLSASGMAPIAVGNGTLRIRGGVTNRYREGFALPGGDPGDGLTGGAVDAGDRRNDKLRTNTDLDQTDGFGAIRYDHRSGAFFGLTGTAYTAERGVAPEQHITAPRYWRYPSQSRSLGIASAGTGVQRTPFGFGSLNASAGVTTQDLEIETYSNRTYSTISSTEKGRERTSIARIEATHSLPFAAQLKLAGTFSNVAYDETLNAQLATSTATRFEQKLNSYGAELEVPIASRLLVSGGVVQDEASTPETGGRTSLGTLQKTGWRVGSTLLVNDGVRLHASVSERARFPALRELYSGALNRFDPNPNLRPENLLGFEGGITLDGGKFADNGFMMQVVGFRHVLDDAVIRITLPNRLFRRINRDEIRSAGAEVLTSWAPVALKGATITADATIQKIRVYDQTITTANERVAEHNPERRGSLAVISPTLAGFRASVMGRYTGTQYCQHPDLGRQVELAAQTVADAAVTRTFSMRSSGLLQRLTALVAMDNLGNKTVYDQCGLPQPGRTIRFGLTLN